MIELMPVITEERAALELCRAVAAIGPQATPRLSEALTDERVIVRKGAALALILLGPDAKQAVPDLIVALEDEALEFLAAQALAAIGPAAKDAAPALVKRLPYGRWPLLRAIHVYRYDCWPATALGRIGPGAIPAVLDAVKTDNLNQMAGCFVALKVMGPAARETAPAIIEAMGRADEPRVNSIGIEALLAIEADKDVVLAVVRPLAKDPRYKHNRSVHYALKQLESRE
jgi:HEAT repeat protein